MSQTQVSVCRRGIWSHEPTGITGITAISPGISARPEAMDLSTADLQNSLHKSWGIRQGSFLRASLRGRSEISVALSFDLS